MPLLRFHALTTLCGLTILGLAASGAWAGDILRGGAAAGERGIPNDAARKAAAAAMNARARDRLAQTTQMVVDMRAVQANAQQAAAASAAQVTDGLAEGGLKVLTGPNAKWVGAAQPYQSGNNVNIVQNAAQAVLHWETFNVGRNTTVNFDQSLGGASAGEWIAFNKVFDPSARPSQILGRINAQGQVYIINQNGIIFGAGSQVNTRTLVASSLPINDKLVERGLLNQEAGKPVEFLFAAAAGTTPGDVTVEPGATISSPVNADGNGGRIMLIGPNVRNSGTLSAPAGQTILAAGRQVGFDAHPTADPTLRGLDVYVGQVDSASGEAVNAGLIEAPRASVIIAGKNVRQLGVIESSTSTALNGRVDLLANFNAKTYTEATGSDYPTSQASTTPLFYQGESGSVELGSGSLIRILPELAGTDRTVGTKLVLGSLVNIQGRSVHLGAGSVIHAPGASLPTAGIKAVDGSRDQSSSSLLAGITVRAGNWIRTTGLRTRWANSDRQLADDGQPYVGGQIYFEPGAIVDVAGSVNVPIPLSQKLLNLQLRGAELANSPLQRDSMIRGESITVDLRRSGSYNGQFWTGTPLGDVSGYEAIIQRGVGELTVEGGTVALTAGESVVMQKGSIIDVSGGSLEVAGGKVNTTRLWHQGRLVDIAAATPDQVYDGIYTPLTTQTSAKWGVTSTYRNPLAPTGEYMQQTYIEGADAGTITINAASVALDGQLLGNAVNGPRQDSPSESDFGAPPTLARGGTFALNLRNEGLFNNALAPQSPTPPDVVFSTSQALPPADAFAIGPDGVVAPLRADRKNLVILSPDLLAGAGFATLTVDNSDGDITVPAGAPLTAPALGSITLRGANINVAAPVTAPGGSLNFTAFNYSPYEFNKFNGTVFEPPTPAPDPDRGVFTLAPGALLSTAGLVTDNGPGRSQTSQAAPIVSGGDISVTAYTARLSEGTSIDASGGLAVSSTGRRQYGSGGDISIAAGRDPSMTWLLGGRLTLGSTLQSYSGGRLAGIDASGSKVFPDGARFRGFMDGAVWEAKGGSLAIQAPLIQVGGEAPAGLDADEVLQLSPDFFTRGGFTSYALTGLGRGVNAQASEFLPGIAIAPGTVIEPVAATWRAAQTGGRTTLQPFQRVDSLAPPVSLSFAAPVARDGWDPTDPLISRGDIVMGVGARIETQPAASVSFRGGTVAILGSVSAPGGSISVVGSSSFPLFIASDLAAALPTVHLGSQSLLSAAGRTVSLADPFGRNAGTVLPGGSISVEGNIVAEAGAILDVSGARGVLDVHPSLLVENLLRPGGISAAVPRNSGLTAQPFFTVGQATLIESDAGDISLRGSEELFVDATLRGFAGGPSAKGGTLTVSSGSFIDRNAGGVDSPLNINLIVRQEGSFIPAGFYPEGETAIGTMVPVADGSSALGRGRFAADRFLGGGFDSLKLSGGALGAVSFEGPVSIVARRSIDLAEGGVIFADSTANLSAPYIRVGTPFQSPLQLATPQADDLSFPGRTFAVPTSGPGSLSLNGSLLDVGKLSLQGISVANFTAADGDIRGNGTINIAGTLNLTAGQIYPTTAGIFTITAYDPNISVASSSRSSRTVKLASAALPQGFGLGSALLGSTVVAIQGDTVTLAGNADSDVSGGSLVIFAPGEGRVNIAKGNTSRPMPLSAGGTLSIYASKISQNGTLRAPFGTINLGWDGRGTAPIDYLSGAGVTSGRSVPVTEELTLGAGSVTSVSGRGLVVPYGLNLDESAWIDPFGVDIAGGGLPTKTVNLAALNVASDDGAVIDLEGGGDLFAYRWVQGNGGSHDVLGTPSADWSSGASYQSGQLVWFGGAIWSARRSNQGVQPSVGLDWTKLPEGFAVVPGYAFDYAPYAPFNNRSSSLNLVAADPGYVSGSLSVGDQIYLGASSGLAAGRYTLLPARYALLPGAVFIAPKSTSLNGSIDTTAGTSIVSGYQFNGLSPSTPALVEKFQVVPGNVVNARAQYDLTFASDFLKQSAIDLGLPVPRLPQDAGRAVVSGLNSLRFDGTIAGRGASGGYGAEIDFSTLAEIRLVAAGGSAAVGVTALDTAKLSSYGAGSILIGGLRRTTTSGTAIEVTAASVTVDNAGSVLQAGEIILAAKQRVEVAAGAAITQSGQTKAAAEGSTPTLLVGDATVAGSGNGVLLRVSDVQAEIVRANVSTQAQQALLASPPRLSVGAGASLSGPALTLDSTYAMQVDPAATLSGADVSLRSGQISLQLTDAGTVPVIPGLMLDQAALRNLQASRNVSFLSYSSIDLYGAGNFAVQGRLSLSAGQIRSFIPNGGTFALSAPEVLLRNSSTADALLPVGASSGRLLLDAGTLRLGAGNTALQGALVTEARTANGLSIEGTGQLSTSGSLLLRGPVITSSGGSYAITSADALDFGSSGLAPTATLPVGLGGALALTAKRMSIDSAIVLPAGSISLRATDGDIAVGTGVGGGSLDVSGREVNLGDITAYADAGGISLTADHGSVQLGSQAAVTVASAAGGGNAGRLSISAAQGTFVSQASLAGRGSTGGTQGSFSLDVLSLPSVTSIDATLNGTGFTESRVYRIRQGDVRIEGLATARNYEIFADTGSILATSAALLDASGTTGGNIRLASGGSVTIDGGARLSVRGARFDSAGKGGAITLEGGTQINGVVNYGAGAVVDIRTGSTLDLSVDAQTAGSSRLGQLSGKLHLRAPQNLAGTDVQVAPIGGQILGASSVLVEGYRLYDLGNTTGAITSSGANKPAGGLLLSSDNVRGSIAANAQAFLGASGVTTAGYTAMFNRLLGSDPQGLASIFVLAPGAEIIKRNGDITLGTSATTFTGDWDLSSQRYGPKGAPGVLTIRASGNLVFLNALSDGFTKASADALGNTIPAEQQLYRAELSPLNPNLPFNQQSWSFRLSAGADLAAANFAQLLPISSLAAGKGSLQVGKLITANSGNPVAIGGANATTAGAIGNNRYQVIRTGSGDITISAGRDVQLLNQFATIYTAGTRTDDPTIGGRFELPPVWEIGDQGALGAQQQAATYAAQYSLGGGNVRISAQNDIKRQTQSSGGLVADSQKQIPNNWLYRRGYVDPVTGEFAFSADNESGTVGSIASTSWWVDFSNFFQGVGALGGGHVALAAGNDVSNVDAVAPTSARMTYVTETGNRQASAQDLIELGGGDVSVTAGRDIDAGIYYVERGTGVLKAGRSVTSNRTRTASIGALGTGQPTDYAPSLAQWLPTTLFLGKGGFKVAAGGDINLGPVVNPFLLPVGLNNSFWRKSYFSTYAPDSYLDVVSLAGSVTLRQNSSPNSLGANPSSAPILQAWMEAVHRLASGTVSFRQPWLRLAESGTTLSPFASVFNLMPGTVRAVSLADDINLVGRFNLSPSPVGNVSLAGADAINGLQPSGIYRPTATTRSTAWVSSTVNLSDADPASIRSILTPYALQSIAGAVASGNQRIPQAFLLGMSELFNESGSSSGRQATIQVQQALHGRSLLHASSTEPLVLFAGAGDISGLTLFSPKAANISAGRDITDVALYIQNTGAADASIVQAGRDIVPYNANSVLRNSAQASGNQAVSSQPQAGDIQISGPGSLLVQAGRNLDLGSGANNPDGTGVGITSIGNARNPNLPFTGASLYLGAGLGASEPDYETFINRFINGPDGPAYLAQVSALLGGAGFDDLTADQQKLVALQVFYLVLRDAGRETQQGGSYDKGFEAIRTLFPGAGYSGELITRARDIRTRSGGDISIFVPGGGLTLATATVGTSLVPPGIVTEAGGNIGIFTDGDVDIGISRIFTLRGGNQIIWSSAGDIAAGASSKTIQSAPPTRVLIDPQTAALKVDLGGLATGGGIGVLASVEGVEPGSVDLIAPTGTVDAGDAGIRATGDLNIAADQVLNADNITAGGTSVGVPAAPVVAAPNIAGLTAGSTATAASTSAAQNFATQSRPAPAPAAETPSVITVEVLGYGGAADAGTPDGAEAPSQDRRSAAL
ncbi:MAG: filamentous hemagglutinin family protein [Chthoniobacterales bacterium]